VKGKWVQEKDDRHVNLYLSAAVPVLLGWLRKRFARKVSRVRDDRKKEKLGVCVTEKIEGTLPGRRAKIGVSTGSTGIGGGGVSIIAWVVTVAGGSAKEENFGGARAEKEK